MAEPDKRLKILQPYLEKSNEELHRLAVERRLMMHESKSPKEFAAHEKEIGILTAAMIEKEIPKIRAEQEAERTKMAAERSKRAANMAKKQAAARSSAEKPRERLNEAESLDRAIKHVKKLMIPRKVKSEPIQVQEPPDLSHMNIGELEKYLERKRTALTNGQKRIVRLVRDHYAEDRETPSEEKIKRVRKRMGRLELEASTARWKLFERREKNKRKSKKKKKK